MRNGIVKDATTKLYLCSQKNKKYGGSHGLSKEEICDNMLASPEISTFYLNDRVVIWLYECTMYERTNVRMYWCMNVLTYECTDVWTYWRMNALTYECADVWTYWCMNVLTYLRIDVWTYGCTNVWTDCTHTEKNLDISHLCEIKVVSLRYNQKTHRYERSRTGFSQRYW